MNVAVHGLAAALVIVMSCGRARLGASLGSSPDGSAGTTRIGAGGGGQTPSAPSCLPGGPGMSDCGANRSTASAGAATESCCTSLEVTGGTYARTYLHYGPEPTNEADPAALTRFRLDKYLVTVGRFRQFVTAWNHGSGWMPAAGSGKHVHLNGGRGLANSALGQTYEPGWLAADNVQLAPTSENLACSRPPAEAGVPSTYNTWTPTPAGQENLPVTCVNWYEAMAFCIWDGGFLPSEAEWEYAAAGGNELRKYPWGSAEPGTLNQYAIYGCNYPTPATACTGVASIAPPGSATLGVGRWGQYDLAGDVWEWVLDAFAQYVTPCLDCAYFGQAPTRMLRGSDFGETAVNLTPSHRYRNPPAARFYNFGLRCARSP